MSTSATYAVNLPLTNYIIGWYGTQTHDPARFLAPGTQAPGLLTTYKRYLRQDAFAASDTRRPMYDSPRTIDIRGEDVPVMLEEHALKIGIDDRELLGAVDAEVYRTSLRQAKTRALARRMLISHNKEVFDYANSVIPGITSVDGITEANKWSDRTKPVVSILTSLINKFAVNNGVYPNRILTTRDVWADIQANTEVQTMMGEMGRKVLTPETLLELIGLQATTSRRSGSCAPLPPTIPEVREARRWTTSISWAATSICFTPTTIRPWTTYPRSRRSTSPATTCTARWKPIEMKTFPRNGCACAAITRSCSPLRRP